MKSELKNYPEKHTVSNEQICLAAERELRAISAQLRQREQAYTDSIAVLIDRRRELFQTLDNALCTDDGWLTPAGGTMPCEPPPEVLYMLTLRPLPSDVPPIIRLRRILKSLLRTYDFRCVDYREVAENSQNARSVAITSGSGESTPAARKSLARLFHHFK